MRTGGRARSPMYAFTSYALCDQRIINYEPHSCFACYFGCSSRFSESDEHLMGPSFELLTLLSLMMIFLKYLWGTLFHFVQERSKRVLSLLEPAAAFPCCRTYGVNTLQVQI